MVKGIVLGIVSGKGGVGKTTTAINLGTALHHRNERVVLIDGSFTKPNISIHLGSPKTPTTLNDVLAGRIPVDQAFYVHASGLCVIPSPIGPTFPEDVDYEALGKLLALLKATHDYIIIDAQPGLGTDVHKTISLTDAVLIVTAPDILSLTDALKTVHLTQHHNKPIAGIVLNNVRREYFELDAHNIEEILEHPVI
ncbi:hypothetical protein COY95_01125, partial [Candidatus Woesearchaeota archaeon CG_4_10_14_0_8_um_filter_47_5]